MVTASIALSVLLTGASASSWSHFNRTHSPRDGLAAVPPAVCLPFLPASLTPVCYIKTFSSTTVIDPFQNGIYLSVSSVPTTVITTTTFTRTGAAPTVIPTTAVGGKPTTRHNNGDNAPASSSGSSLNGTTLPTDSAMDPTKPVTSAKASSTLQPLIPGQGIPTGAVTELPSDQFIFLAFSTSSTDPLLPTPRPMPREAAVVRRQNREIPAQMKPLKLVDLQGPEVAAGSVSPDQCDSADPLTFREGRLMQFENSVGKAFNETLTTLGFTIPAPDDHVNRGFTILNGVLQWNATDIGEAVFLSCSGQIVAAFEGILPPGCTQVVLGAISGDVCRRRVQRSRSPNPAFTAPVASELTPGISNALPTAPPANEPTSSKVTSKPASVTQSGRKSSAVTSSPPASTKILSSPVWSLSLNASRSTSRTTTASLSPTTSPISLTSTLAGSASLSSTCSSPIETQDNAINSRMAEALRTGNPDIVTESELLRQVPASLNGRRNVAFGIVPNDTTVTWLLDPLTGYVRNPGALDILLKGTRNTVSSKVPANKTLAAVGVVPNSKARAAYFGGNPFVTNDAGKSSYRAVSDPGMIAVLKNTVSYLVPPNACSGSTSRKLQGRQDSAFAHLRIVLSQAKNGGSETSTLTSLQALFPGAVINGGSTVANACDFVSGQPNPCLGDANLLIIGDDTKRGDDTIAQQVATLHQSGLALLVMGEDGNPEPLSQKIMALLGVTVGQNYFSGKTVIEQATKEYLVPTQVISDQISEDALTLAKYLKGDPLVPEDYSSCLSKTTSGVGDIRLQDCIEGPDPGVTTHARPYFAALKRFRQILDGLSSSGTDIFSSTFGSQTEIVRVLALLADKYRRGPGKQPGDTAIGIAYPVDLRSDGAAAGRSFYADWLTPRATKATGRPLSLGSLYCPTEQMALTDLASCQSPSFPGVGDYPLTLRSAPEDRFTATGFDQVPGRPSTVTLLSDPGFPVYLRFLAGSDGTSRATLLSKKAVSTYNRPSFAVGPYVRLLPGKATTLNTPYGGPLYVRLAASESSNPTDVKFAFTNVARHPTLFYPATDDDVAKFAADVSTSTAYWADIVDDVFEVHSPILKIKSALSSDGQDVEAPPRRVYYNTTNGLRDLVNDFRNSWAGNEYMLAGLKIRSEPLSSTLSVDDQKICSDLGLPCLDETINSRVAHQHITFDAYAACGGLCSGNPITISGDPSPISYGEGHELGHNLQRKQLGIFWPDTAVGSQLSKVDSWTSYAQRDGETSNNIFPIDNIYRYFRFTLPARSSLPPDNGRIGSHDPRKDVDTFSAYASAYSKLRQNGKQVTLDARCRVLGTYPIGTPPDVMLADSIWGNGAYAASNGLRLTFYVPLPDLLQGRTMFNGRKLSDGRDIYTLLYQAARAFTTYAVNEETWKANRATLGLSLYEFRDDAVYGPKDTVNAMIGNDFMLVALCRITGYDFRPYFASRGVFYTRRANQQVEANAAKGSPLRTFGRRFLALNTQLPQVNRTTVPADSPNAYKSNDVFFDATDPATVWPGSDDDRNGVAETFIGFHPRSCPGVTVG